MESNKAELATVEEAGTQRWGPPSRQHLGLALDLDPRTLPA